MTRARMSTGHSRYDSAKGRPGPGSRVGGREESGALLRGDPLRCLMNRHPLFVGAVFLVFGWGSLLLLAWRLEVITSSFLRNPAFMVGDLVLLPLCGAMMAAFYRASIRGMRLDLGRWIVVGSGLIATIAAGATAAFSILLTDTYHGIWSVPHTLFIWFFAYTFVSFLPRAFILVSFGLSRQGLGRILFNILLPLAHIVLKSIMGGSLP